MEISIIVVNFNAGDYLLYTLGSIKRNLIEKSEVIVVDNNSEDDSFEKARSFFPEFKYIESKKNLGYGGGCNLGAKYAKGEILVFSNSDIILTEGGFTKIKKYFEKDDKIGIIGPRFEYPDGTYQPSCRRYPRFKYLLFGRKSPVSLLFKNNPITREFLYLNLKDQKKAVEVEGIVGAFFAVKKKVFNEIGGFDRNFFLFAEDIDLCLRIKRKGYKILHAPDIKIIHFHGCSRKYLGLKSDYYLKKSIYKFFKKHNSLNPVKKVLLNLGLFTAIAISSMASIFYKDKK